MGCVQNRHQLELNYVAFYLGWIASSSYYQHTGVFALNGHHRYGLFCFDNRCVRLHLLLGLNRLKIVLASCVYEFFYELIFGHVFACICRRSCKLTKREEKMALPCAILAQNEGEGSGCLPARRTGAVPRNSLADVVSSLVALT